MKRERKEQHVCGANIETPPGGEIWGGAIYENKLATISGFGLGLGKLRSGCNWRLPACSLIGTAGREAAGPVICDVV